MQWKEIVEKCYQKRLRLFGFYLAVFFILGTDRFLISCFIRPFNKAIARKSSKNPRLKGICKKLLISSKIKEEDVHGMFFLYRLGSKVGTDNQVFLK